MGFNSGFKGLNRVGCTFRSYFSECVRYKLQQLYKCSYFYTNTKIGLYTILDTTITKKRCWPLYVSHLLLSSANGDAAIPTHFAFHIILSVPLPLLFVKSRSHTYNRRDWRLETYVQMLNELSSK